ncbi:hypothetical protein [Streptomyces hirsutus]|uniref:hypothetical protein n=1 Tax=Streptomyces hirsutus TaxID=35620 RepID=UPI0006E13FC4|nr:hypothetical protein [Streptomyces hirsutus]
MTDRRRPLGTGPVHAAEVDAELPPVPRAQLAAERLPASPALTEPRLTRSLVGRRVLGAGPVEW